MKIRNQLVQKAWPVAYFFILILASSITGCMMFAVWENDFSNMKDDVISSLIKQFALSDTSFSNKQVNEDEYTTRFNQLYYGKKKEELLALFKENDDSCEFTEAMGKNERNIKCEAKRWWRIINVGHPYFGLIKEINPYIYPGIKLEFYIRNNSDENIERIDIKYINTTIHKAVRRFRDSKPPSVFIKTIHTTTNRGQ
ncbi:MAG: hypothetical protein CTY16_10355 [Methylobacter sp.]|nr:MAG: hypothetical protein CTY16_10355 [Methylobacter sp.]